MYKPQGFPASPAICCYITLWKSKIQKYYWFRQHPQQLSICSWGQRTWFNI